MTERSIGISFVLFIFMKKSFAHIGSHRYLWIRRWLPEFCSILKSKEKRHFLFSKYVEMIYKELSHPLLVGNRRQISKKISPHSLYLTE